MKRPIKLVIIGLSFVLILHLIGYYLFKFEIINRDQLFASLVLIWISYYGVWLFTLIEYLEL